MLKRVSVKKMGRSWQEERSDGEDASSLLDRRRRRKKYTPCWVLVYRRRSLVFLKLDVLGDWRAGAPPGAAVKGRRVGDARKKYPAQVKKKGGALRKKAAWRRCLCPRPWGNYVAIVSPAVFYLTSQRLRRFRLR